MYRPNSMPPEETVINSTSQKHNENADNSELASGFRHCVFQNNILTLYFSIRPIHNAARHQEVGSTSDTLRKMASPSQTLRWYICLVHRSGLVSLHHIFRMGRGVD